MVLSDNDHMVETLSPHAAEKSLDHRIHQRGADRRLDDPCAGPLRYSIELGTVLVVPVADDELRPRAEWSGVAELGPMFSRT